jgi:predicted secreted protein
MSWTLGIALYFIIWWVSLFVVLPFGVHTQAEADGIVRGTPESAPAAVNMWRTFARTTVVSIVVFTAVWLALRYRLIPLDTGLPLRP